MLKSHLSRLQSDNLTGVSSLEWGTIAAASTHLCLEEIFMPDISALLAPRSIAIIGASPDASIIRGKVQKMLQLRDYAGKIYPVSRRHAEVQGLTAYASIANLPEAADLAVIAIPAQDVPGALEECGAAGIRAAYIISSGFAEEGAGSGADLQAKLLEVAKRYDMAICGPNGEGFFNRPDNVVATFSPAFAKLEQPLAPETDLGRAISIASQSGGIGFSYFHRGRPRQLRFNHIVSTGNEATLGSFDFVEWFIEHGDADVIMLYLEAIRDADTMRRVASLAADRGKPIVLAKMGRTDVGARAAASHTAALAGSDTAYDAVFRRYGITRAYDMDQQNAIAAAFAFCKLPKGKRVAVLAGSGGSGVWMADTLAVHGLEVPPFDDETRAAIDRLIPSYGSSGNPVDLTAQAVHQVGYAHVLEILQRSPSIDAVVVVGSLAYTTILEKDAAEFRRVIREGEKPTVFCTFTLASPEAFEIAAKAGMPVYTSMPDCAVALRALAEYSEFHERWKAEKELPERMAQTAEQRSGIVERLNAEGKIVGEHDAKNILKLYGIDCPDETVAGDADSAAVAAAAIGYPVALKLHARGLAHKTDVGGIALGLRDPGAVKQAFNAMIERVKSQKPDLAVEGVIVQPMAKKGVEMVIGITRDAVFGPMLMVGLGGIHIEVLKDVAFAPAPITRADAERLLKRLNGYKLLEGVRGAAPADVGALVELVVALSNFAADFAVEVAEVELNPVIVHAHGDGVTIVDALIVKPD